MPKLKCILLTALAVGLFFGVGAFLIAVSTMIAE